MDGFKRRNSKGFGKMIAFWRKPDVQDFQQSDAELEKALANLRRADVHYQEATAIIEKFVRDFKKTNKARYEQ